MISSAHIFPCEGHWWTYIKKLPWNTNLLTVWNILNIEKVCFLQSYNNLKKNNCFEHDCQIFLLWPCFREFEKGTHKALILEWLICDYLYNNNSTSIISIRSNMRTLPAGYFCIDLLTVIWKFIYRGSAANWEMTALFIWIRCILMSMVLMSCFYKREDKKMLLKETSEVSKKLQSHW